MFGGKQQELPWYVEILHLTTAVFPGKQQALLMHLVISFLHSCPSDMC